MKHCLKVNESVLPETTDPDYEFRYIEIGAVESGNLIEPPGRMRFRAAPSRARRIVKDGDTLVSTVRTYLKAVWFAENPGDDLICSTGFAVLTPRIGMIPKFASYAVLSAPFTDQVTTESVGIAYPAISETKFANLPIPVPPPEEQAAIVRFLDHADEQIQRYIASKERLIALMEEEYKVATWEAIRSPNTRSLRLEVATDWIRRPVARFDQETYIPVGLYNRGRGIFQKEPTKGSDLGDSDFFWLEEGDLVISGQFAWEGAIALADSTIDGCIASHRYPILQGKPRISDPRFLLMFFQTEWGHLLLDNHSRGAAGRNRPLNIRTLLKEKIPLPKLEDQLLLARMLDNQQKLRQQTRLIEEHLNEYRTRLIADVVTGQLDVRTNPRKPSEIPT